MQLNILLACRYLFIVPAHVFIKKILKFPSWKSGSRGQIGFLQEVGEGRSGGGEEERENLKKTP